MAPGVVDTVLQAAFYSQLVIHGFGLDFNLLTFLLRSIRARKSPGDSDPSSSKGSHHLGEVIGKASWHLSIALSLYLFSSGQSMDWYITVFGYLTSQEAILALLETSFIQGLTLSDWYWSFGQYTWFYVSGIQEPLWYLFGDLSQPAIDKAEDLGLKMDWAGLLSSESIQTRILAITMNIPRPDPGRLRRSIFEIKLRVASITPFRLFTDTIPSTGSNIYDALQVALLRHTASPSFSWDLMWVYAPRDMAYIARVEWEKLEWIGAMLLEKMVHDAIWLAGTSLSARKLTALTTILTSKETLAALLDSASYYGPHADVDGLPSLKTARTHFLVLFALSYLTFVQRANHKFVSWFMDVFCPLVRLLDQEYEEQRAISDSSEAASSSPLHHHTSAGLPGGTFRYISLQRHMAFHPAGASSSLHGGSDNANGSPQLVVPKDKQIGAGLGGSTTSTPGPVANPIVRPPSFLKRLSHVRDMKGLVSLFAGSPIPNNVADQTDVALPKDSSSQTQETSESEHRRIRHPRKRFSEINGITKSRNRKGGVNKTRR